MTLHKPCFSHIHFMNLSYIKVVKKRGGGVIILYYIVLYKICACKAVD